MKQKGLEQLTYYATHIVSPLKQRPNIDHILDHKDYEKKTKEII